MVFSLRKLKMKTFQSFAASLLHLNYVQYYEFNVGTISANVATITESLLYDLDESLRDEHVAYICFMTSSQIRVSTQNYQYKARH